MAQGFIKIKEERIRKNIIKHYQPYGEKKLNLYYNSSRYKLEVQTFEFESKFSRNEALFDLDLKLGL